MTTLSFKARDFEYLIELNEEQYPVRVIIKDKEGNIKVSSKENCLPERALEYNEDIHTLITQKKFDEAWNQVHYELLTEWNDTKKSYPLEKEINVVVECFYPQGIICESNQVRFLTSDIKYIEEEEFLYPSDPLDGIVSGYDDVNMWIIFKHK